MTEIKGKHKDVNERNFKGKKNTWKDKGRYEKNTSNKVIKLENDLLIPRISKFYSDFKRHVTIRV